MPPVTISTEQWDATRAALKDTAERFAALVSTRDPAIMATRDWSIADTVAHVTAIALWDTALTRPGGPLPHPWNLAADQIPITTVDTVHALNDQILAGFTERDPAALAERLRAHIDDMLSASTGHDPDTTVAWLGGSHVPLAGVFAHLTNELQIHGRDIARAVDVKWVIPPAYAAQFLDVFVAGIARNGPGRLLDSDQPAPGRRITARLVSRDTRPLTLVVLPDGSATAGDPEGPVDVRIRFEPATFNLMMFGRISKVRAALSGKVVVAGPRPWLLPAFLRVFRFPS
jgi:uncharacterized protein (TIGR03083 family)